MRPFGALAHLTICATLLCAVGSAGVAMDLREMPPWLRAMIEPVHLGPAAEVETVQVGAAGALAPAVGIGAGPGTVGVSAPGTGPVSVGGGVSLRAWGTPGAGAVHAPGMGGPTGPAPVGISAAGAATVGIGAGPATVGIGAPGAGPVSVGGGVSLEAWGVPGGGAVHAPGIGGPTGPAPVSISAAAQDWSEAVSSIEELDRETLAQAGQILAMIRERGMSAEEFAAWTAEHRPAPEVLSAAVAMVGFHRHDNYPTPQPEALAIASGLAALAGDDLSQVEAIPPFGRLWLAILFSTRGDGPRAEKSFTSMTDEELVRLPRETAVMTIAHLIRHAPLSSVATIKRYADASGQRAEWCSDLMFACRRVDSRDIVRDELIPYAQSALEAMPPTTGWSTALKSLMWGLLAVGDPRGAARAAREWFAAVEEMGAGTATPEGNECRLLLARALAETGDWQGAGTVLREVATSDASSDYVVAQAQCALLKLAAVHPDMGSVDIVPPRFETVHPEAIRWCVQRHQRTARVSLWVVGNPTFRVLNAAATHPAVAATRGGIEYSEARSGTRIEVEVDLSQSGERLEARLTLTTNDPLQPKIAVPISLRMVSPVLVSPATMFFGFVEKGSAGESVVTLKAEEPFAITGISVDRAELLSITVEPGTARTQRVTARLQTEGIPVPTVVEGVAVVETDLVGSENVHIPYYLHVTD